MKWRNDEKAQASIFSITGTWPVDWEKDGGGARSLALLGNSRIEASDNSKAYAFYDPTSRVPLGAVGKPVPATDEIDWIADDVPCLALGAAVVMAAKWGAQECRIAPITVVKGSSLGRRNPSFIHHRGGALV